ncbi:ubiquitin carboxyl-terminal hydrolase 19 isoform X3 [Lepisosteus oculatus]|uniref:ubiquitin carboxyl-terminal hydrolase 19 isoform X3 n=1 Tax=Lepisosteus oculatus TaxID=7918 RepID=UPI00371904AF
MASTTEAAGCRRPSRGPEDSTSKKKQKDKANQESKEAKRASSLETKKELSCSQESLDETNFDDVFYDWKQNANEVIVKLKPGEGVMKVEDVDAGFSDTACQVKFPDGRLWSCHLHAEIESSCSKVQYKEKGSFLQLVMQKKIPFNAWPSLMRSKKNKDPVQIQTESGKQLPPKVEKLDAEMGKAPVESMEQKRAKVERGLKRAIKAKPSEKSDLGAKMPEAAKPTEKTEPPAEPSAKRTFCTIKTAKDPGLSSGRDSPAKGSEKSQTETSLEAACPLSCNGRSRHKRSDRGPPAALLQERRADSQHMGKSQAVVLEERRGQSVVTEIGSDVLGPPSGGTLNPPTVPCSSGDSEKSDSLDGTVEPAVQVDRETAMIPEVEKRVPELGMVGLGHVGAGEPASIALTEEAGASGTSTEEKRDRCKEETLENQAEVLEPMVNLTFVKNDSYEKGNDFMVVNVYLKGIHRETVKVLFREQDFTLIFQTSDPSFLRLQPGCGPNTVFKWQVKLRNLIHPDQCTYAFTPSRIDITLKKRHSQRWGGLEAPATQGAVGGAKVAVPTGPASLDKSQPGSSQHALPSKEEPRTAEKDKARAEDSALDTVGARTVPEHVPIKQEPLVTSPKPTCMVPPMTHASAGSEHTAEEEEKKVCLPGFTGLVNLGNTCFMNSVIQSLSNTRELRDYFHDRAFETEINCSNPLGTGGRLAIGFAVLLRALWKGTHHAFQPSKLKAIVASKASQFTGYAQHDAQEFMAFLLDGLHEDLNRIQNKPYTETVDSDGRQDEVVAEEAWQRHKMRNDSFIVDLFQGQYKSKLVCPVCSKVSITFDPFLYLPVPLPQKQKVLTVFYFGKEPHKKPVKFLVSVSKENSSTAEVLESISRSVRVKPENLRLAEVIKSRFHRIFLPSHSLDAVSPSDTLFCFEVLSKELAKEKVLVLQVQQRPLVPSIPIAKCAACQKPPQSQEEKVKRCTRCYRVGYCNQICQKNHWPDHKTQCRPNMENIGYPFLISVPESRLTFSRLTQLLEGYSRYSVSVFQPPFQTGRMSPEVSQCRADLPPETLDSSCQESVLAQEAEKEGPSLSSEPHTNSEQPPGNSVEEPDSMTSLTTESGFSAPVPETQDSVLEKETSCEKTVKPEAAVTGYQQPPELQAHSASQFYISLIDSANKEQRLEDKGDALLEIAEDCSLVLVWKNNERQKEYVLIKSKELEFVEDPGSASEAARAGHFTLEQCLNLFTKPEVLAPEEAWYCPKCKQHREASKQLMLWRLPNVLIIQLKRFSFRSFIWRDKINDMVDFPVRSLDLSKFCIGQKDDSQPPIYDLYAVINHYGGMIGGHYTAYARLPNDKNSQRSDVGWRLFDDSTVTTVEESQVVTRYAYVLFYRRRNSPVERPTRLPSPQESPATAGASASQASLIWHELEEEEEGQEDSIASTGGRLRGREEARRGWGELDELSDYSDENFVKYFVLGTLAAVLALVLNVVYPLISKSHWS